MVKKPKHNSDFSAPARSPKRKRVGDETPNPLPDGHYSVDQPPDDANPSSTDGGSSAD
jgi:hypothetical protein